MTVDILPIQHRGLAVALQLALEAALIRRARGPAPQQPTTSAIALEHPASQYPEPPCSEQQRTWPGLAPRAAPSGPTLIRTHAPRT